MEVISHGKVYGKIQCPYCDAILGYAPHDLVRYNTQDKIGDKEYTMEKIFISCPECENKIVLKNDINEVKPKEKPTKANSTSKEDN